jgi:hypothetical protein
MRGLAKTALGTFAKRLRRARARSLLRVLARARCLARTRVSKGVFSGLSCRPMREFSPFRKTRGALPGHVQGAFTRDRPSKGPSQETTKRPGKGPFRGASKGPCKDPDEGPSQEQEALHVPVKEPCKGPCKDRTRARARPMRGVTTRRGAAHGRASARGLARGVSQELLPGLLLLETPLRTPGSTTTGKSHFQETEGLCPCKRPCRGPYTRGFPRPVRGGSTGPPALRGAVQKASWNGPPRDLFRTRGPVRGTEGLAGHPEALPVRGPCERPALRPHEGP